MRAVVTRGCIRVPLTTITIRCGTRFGWQQTLPTRPPIEVIAQKRASIQNRTQEDRVPDFTKESPTVSVSEKRKLEFDRAKIEGQLRQWSQVFREFPNIQSSSVSIRARMNHRYVVNSEGTRTMSPELLVILQASATAQAADGMVVSNSVPVYARDFSDLPSTEAYTAAIRQMAKDLTALREAPVLEADYSGPALLVGQVATEMFARVLAPNLTGQRGALSTQRTECDSAARRSHEPSDSSVVHVRGG